MNTITTYETHESAYNADEYGIEPEYSRYQIKDYAPRNWDEISKYSRKRIQRLLNYCKFSTGCDTRRWFVVTHRLPQEKKITMKPLRYEKYKNDFPSKVGYHEIIVSRWGGRVYSLKFMRYGVEYTRVRIYQIDQTTYDKLLAYYGKIIQHGRIMSEYILAQNRRLCDIWIARYKRNQNVYVVYPNHTAERLNIQPKRLMDNAIYWTGWQPEFDAFGNRWLYTTFKVTRKVLQNEN